MPPAADAETVAATTTTTIASWTTRFIDRSPFVRGPDSGARSSAVAWLRGIA
jgi:hypothetical protein